MLNEAEFSVSCSKCYDDSIEVVENLSSCLSRGFERHLQASPMDTCVKLLVAWHQARHEQDSELIFDVYTAESKLEIWAAQLMALDPSSSSWIARKFSEWSNSKQYRRIVQNLEGQVVYWYKQGFDALRVINPEKLQECIYILELMSLKVGDYVPFAHAKEDELKKRTIFFFVAACDKLQKCLLSGNYAEFNNNFDCYRRFILLVTCLSTNAEAKDAFNTTNKTVCEVFGREIKLVKESMYTHAFHEIKTRVEKIRTFGAFVADGYALFSEQLKNCIHINSDEWINKLMTMIFDDFLNECDLSRLKYFAVLRIPPSATKGRMQRAYEILRSRFREGSTDFSMIKEAHDELDSYLQDVRDSSGPMPFDNCIRNIGSNLRILTQKYLQDEDYGAIESLLFGLREIGILDNLVYPKLDTETIRTDINEIVASHVKTVKINVNTNWWERNYNDLHYNITDLRQMEPHLKAYEDIFPESWTTDIFELVREKIRDLGKQARSYLTSPTNAKESRSDFRSCFLEMGSVLVQLPAFRDFTKKAMSDVLECCLSSDWGTNYIFQLGLSLQQADDVSEEDAHIVHTLLGEFRHFKDVRTLIWNSEIEQKPPEDTINEIVGRENVGGGRESTLLCIDQESLLNRFLEFDSLYKSFLMEFLKPEADRKVLLQRIQDVANELKPIRCNYGLVPQFQDAIPKIMAGVFCLFTLITSGESYGNLAEAKEEEQIDLENVLMKPHNIQVVTLLCMFGCGDPSSTLLQSQLMQIRTGEGKSIILGAAATIFALLGLRSSCVCYSEYLSNRDYELFKDVFQQLGVSSFIKYCTITKLSETSTAAKGNIRELTLSLLRGNMTNEMSPTAQRFEIDGITEEILLVDEVDVFFGNDFYGQTYNQVAQLKEPEITATIHRIWMDSKKGKKRLRLDHIKRFPEYGQLLRKFPKYEFLLENEILSMLRSVKVVDEHVYHLDPHSDRIGYRIMDTISYDVTYGYKTIFAYMKEADNGNLQNRDAALERVLAMPISCGQFSYANISPSRILGVSGTLDALGDYERDVLKSYGVTRFLNVPSVYGESNFEFDCSGNGISIEKGMSDYYRKINQVMTEEVKKGRAVILFFRDTQRLNEYQSSPFYRKLGRKKNTLSEDMIPSERDFVISKAATKGQITICTAMFGRGTDFFCKDESVEKSGGVLILQVFLSSQKSEEIQIQGRYVQHYVKN